MTKSEILNFLFCRKYARVLIPTVNFCVTMIAGKTVTHTKHGKDNYYSIKEGDKTLVVDEWPIWNCTFEGLKRNLVDIACLYYVPKIGDVVIELGSGVGTETIVLQSLVGSEGIIYAIEAHPITATKLEKMCNANLFENVKVFQIAIGGENCNTYIDDTELHVANSVINNLSSGIQVKMQTLDEFVNEQAIKRINFFKVNIEGAEESMLNGMIESIKIIDNLAISCHDFLEDKPTDRIKQKVTKFLTENGFSVMLSNSSHQVRASWVYATRLK